MGRPSGRVTVLRMAVCGVVVLAWTVGVALPAAAQERDHTFQDQEARALFQAGRTAFQAGRFEAALKHFEAAHELSGRPQLLYNVGSAADRLRMDEKALAAFRAYLEQVPDASNRHEVEGRIRVLERSVDRGEAAGASAAVSAEPPPAAATGAPEEREPAPEPTAEAPTPQETARNAELGDAAAPAPEPTDRDPDEGGGVASKWWFWTIVGVVVVGAGVGAGVALAGGGDGGISGDQPGGITFALGRP